MRRRAGAREPQPRPCSLIPRRPQPVGRVSSRRRHAVLLMLVHPAVQRIRRSGHSALHHADLPHRLAAGLGDGRHPHRRAVRLGHGGSLCGGQVRGGARDGLDLQSPPPRAYRCHPRRGHRHLPQDLDLGPRGRGHRRGHPRWVPADFFAAYIGAANPLGVPLATLLGVPFYANGGGGMPIGEALWAKGMPLGTVIALMMGAIAYPSRRASCSAGS